MKADPVQVQYALQVDESTREGREVVDSYQVTQVPSIFRVDPNTGERLGPSLAGFIDATRCVGGWHLLQCIWLLLGVLD